MARKHPVVPASSTDMILPAALLRKGLGAADYATLIADRNQWFRDRDINPGDWSKVSAVIQESGRAHGIPYSALDRAWVRSVGFEEWRRIHQAAPSDVGRT